MRFDDLLGRDVVIWGAGREGRAAQSELARRGIDVEFVITGDGATPTDLPAPVTAGPDAVARLEAAEIVIKSPGVPRTSAVYGRILELGVTVTSLTDLWLSQNAGRVLAVTGTKGKSTTAALAQHVLLSLGRSASLVGNGGTPVTAGDDDGTALAVTEVSSYQAADLTTSPRIVVITSLYPEHLPWHGGYDEYVRDKLNVVAHGPETVVVPDLQGDIARLVEARVGADVRVVDPASFGITVSDDGIAWDGAGRLDRSDVPLHGVHNLWNVALALAAVSALLGAQDGSVAARSLESVRSFRPLAHRLERVPSLDRRAWIDDSLATAPEAVVAALETYPDDRVTLILGGADRGLPFEPIRRYLATRKPDAAVDVVAVGPAGARWVAESATSTGSRPSVSFAQAMERVRSDPSASDVVLLSPGAPSFDEFTSYEQRSEAFRAAAAAPAGR